MSQTIPKASDARQSLYSLDFSERADAVLVLEQYGDAQDIDRLITAQSDKGDANNREVMFWRAGYALEQIAKRLELSGKPRDVAGLIKLTRVDLSVDAAVHSLVTLLKKYAAKIRIADLTGITQLDDVLSQRRSKPVRELDYEGNETVWEPASCVALKALARQELDRRGKRSRKRT